MLQATRQSLVGDRDVADGNIRARVRDRVPDVPRLGVHVHPAYQLHHDERVDAAYVTAGWVFAAFRALHSAVHCTINIVMLRFHLYLLSTLVVWFIGVRAAFHYVGF